MTISVTINFSRTLQCGVH